MIRKKKLIDKKFQLKTTFTIIGIILIAFILIIAISGIVSTDNNRKIQVAVKNLTSDIKKDDTLIRSLFALPESSIKPGTLNKRSEKLEKHIAIIKNIQTEIANLETITDRNRILFALMIVIGILLGIFLYFYLIRLTHRISGPIFVLSRHVRDIINDKDPDIRELRKNDEFKEFYNQFVEMIQKMKDQ